MYVFMVMYVDGVLRDNVDSCILILGSLLSCMLGNVHGKHGVYRR